ncbi:MAG: iron chelate uptake ABC transporter family permease subunit, partial [Cetobacterium sp.]
IVALGVCVSGYIGFVGLIIPHITRMIVGANNKIVLPVSFLSGGIFLMVCDLFARTLFSPTEISVGIITSILGAPYFIYLLLKSRKEEF